MTHLRHCIALSRYRKQWLAVGALCVGAFFLPIRFETDALFYIHLMNAAHLPTFFALTLFAHAFWPWEIAPCRRRLAAAGSMAGLSAAIEVIQPLTGRSESFTDLVNGMMGILLAFVLLASRRKLWALPLTAVCVAVAFQPAWRESAGMRWRAAHFPLLADFETDDELRLWIGNGLGNVRNDDTAIERVRQHATRGEWALRVVTTVSQWPGVRLLSAKQDWRSGKTLAFDAWNDGPAFTLSIRIDDDFPHKERGDRYNTTRELAPGANHITIPIAEIESAPRNRRINLAAVQRTILYVNEPTAQHTFYIDSMRLE